MLYLVATILLNTLIFTLFKLFSRFKVDILQALAVNYLTCVVTAAVILKGFPVGSESVNQPWFPWSLLMGGMFITLFCLMAWRTHEDGMTTTTVANKLSMVIPVLFSIWLYDETISAGKIVGILLAVPAVYFTTRVKENTKPQSILFPIILFVGCGLLDTLVKFVEQSFLQDPAEHSVYLIHTFLTASILGLLGIIVLFILRKARLHWRNIIAGILLGIPNYFSIHYLIRLLHSDYLQSSAAIPVNNIGIVLLSALVAIFFFKEKASGMRILGLVLSIAAIILIALSDLYGGNA